MKSVCGLVIECAVAAMAASSILDLRTLGKVANFSGKPEDWPIWSFKFECWLGLVPDVGSSSVQDVMERTGNATDESPLDMSTFGAEAKQIATSIYYLLVQLVGGRALAIAQGDEGQRLVGLVPP